MRHAARARIPSLLASVAALVVAVLHWRDGRVAAAALMGAVALLLAVLTLRPPRFGARPDRDRPG